MSSSMATLAGAPSPSMPVSAPSNSYIDFNTAILLQLPCFVHFHNKQQRNQNFSLTKADLRRPKFKPKRPRPQHQHNTQLLRDVEFCIKYFSFFAACSIAVNVQGNNEMTEAAFDLVRQLSQFENAYDQNIISSLFLVFNFDPVQTFSQN